MGSGNPSSKEPGCAEQPRSLFEAPAGYEVKTMPVAFNFKVELPKRPD